MGMLKSMLYNAKNSINSSIFIIFIHKKECNLLKEEWTKVLINLDKIEYRHKNKHNK